VRLHQQFLDVRRQGRRVGASWLLRHRKALYREMFPECCLQNEDGKTIYLRHRWSLGKLSSHKLEKF
jgi:hypothetical protein